MSKRPIEVFLADDSEVGRKFTNTAEIRRFLTSERNAWSWLESAPHPAADMTGHFLHHFANALSWVDTFEQGNWDEDTFRNHLVPLYRGNRPQLLFSDIGAGAIIHAIRAKVGDDLAERALSFATPTRDPNMANADDFKAWAHLQLPSSIGAEAWLSEHRDRLAAARRAVQAEVSKHAAATEQLDADYELEKARLGGRLRELTGRAFRAGNRRAAKLRAQADEQIQLIEATRSAYAEQMRLKAPVEYWSAKGQQHATTSGRWGLALAAYVALAALLGTWIFDKAWEAGGVEGALTGRHFLLVAGVGSVLTLLFWGARLGVRIYLGERHLHTDAEERRVMTQAYLALIKEGAASDQERMVILSALFRNAQDGIVRDDGGGGEVGLPAMIARALDTGSRRS